VNLIAAELDPLKYALSLPDDISPRILNISDLKALNELRSRVVSGQLAHPDCYRKEAESPNFPASHLEPALADIHGVICGLIDATGNLVGYGALSFTLPDVPSRADVLDIPAGERPRIGYLSSSMVDQSRLGEGLHHALIDWRIQLCTSLALSHVVSATWPGNYRSWKNLTAHGLRGKKIVDVAQGLQRTVFHRDLRIPLSETEEAQVTVDIFDIEHQRELIDQGFWICRLLRNGDQALAELCLAATNNALICGQEA
jgi:hypothetical protein